MNFQHVDIVARPWHVTIAGEIQGVKIELKYSGTVDGDSMKGTLSAGEFGDGTFTAKRK